MKEWVERAQSVAAYSTSKEILGSLPQILRITTLIEVGRVPRVARMETQIHRKNDDRVERVELHAPRKTIVSRIISASMLRFESELKSFMETYDKHGYVKIIRVKILSKGIASVRNYDVSTNSNKFRLIQ